MSDQVATTTTAPPPSSKRLERVLGAVIALIVVVALGGYALVYGLSPGVIRSPTHTHFHYRIILLNNGRAVNFASDSFQTDYSKDICSAALTKQPIHFHDHNAQYGHVHWAGITGGLILKNYGWNLIGGIPGALGYRFDQGIIPQRVPIHSHALPARVTGTNYYVYTGTATSHTSRNWNDFLKQPLNAFLKNTPVVDASEDAALKAQDMTATGMNDVVGNVVIFAQTTPPTADQVTAQFKTFKLLPDSPCEG